MAVDEFYPRTCSTQEKTNCCPRKLSIPIRKRTNTPSVDFYESICSPTPKESVSLIGSLSPPLSSPIPEMHKKRFSKDSVLIKWPQTTFILALARRQTVAIANSQFLSGKGKNTPSVVDFYESICSSDPEESVSLIGSISSSLSSPSDEV
ncbi:hypothetical protein CEXT_738591 [Caerostris extrusa]|uniref:Uncharacterized protein n=1 Tax=Caerostris extrusa TaxID=172846 RepID=A0AAV4SYA4_CAEEX|nr:hypothetical protein CEXT_738591 [Caerostris extrusa]